MEWPGHEDLEEVHLVEYTIPDGPTGVGMTGPITWTFFDIPPDRFTQDEWVKLFAGWYIQFQSINQEDYAPRFSKKDDQRMIRMLEIEQGMSNVQIEERTQIGGETYYEISARSQSGPVKVAGTLQHYSKIDANDRFTTNLPFMFWYLGCTYYEEADE